MNLSVVRPLVDRFYALKDVSISRSPITFATVISHAWSVLIEWLQVDSKLSFVYQETYNVEASPVPTDRNW
jgi:hypothetical protein